MYAIVMTGGKQYKVTEGLIFETELLNVKENDKIELPVLMLATDEKTLVGSECAKAKVEATVIEHGKGKKLHIFTYKAKKNVRKRQGHRQPYTKLKVTSITLG
ncbi:MAG: 50S ribosomal protein L21 [Corallococcus sp.]|nr:50S ribosomal protein L21 [Corallococcus sp.]